MIRGDKLMIRRAISNVLSNALRHAYPHTCIQVKILEENSKSIINITKTGMGGNRRTRDTLRADNTSPLLNSGKYCNCF